MGAEALRPRVRVADGEVLPARAGAEAALRKVVVRDAAGVEHPVCPHVVRAGNRQLSQRDIADIATQIMHPSDRETSLAGREATIPAELENTARNASPKFELLAVTVRVASVAPGIAVQGPRRSEASSHCTVGVGVPSAAAVNDPCCGATSTNAICGCAVIVGAESAHAHAGRSPQTTSESVKHTTAKK